MKQKILVLSALSSIMFFAPALAFANLNINLLFGSGGFGGFGGMGANCSSAICYLAFLVIDTINLILVPVLFAIAFIVFLYGVFRAYIYSHGDPAEVQKGHQLILWGIIGFVVMISLWGLVNVVIDTLGLGSLLSAPTPPTSY